MKVFAFLAVAALLGGSQANFLDGFKDVFHNLEQTVGQIGKDLLQTATPLANTFLDTLKQAGTQLLSTAASDLLGKLGTATTGTTKRAMDVGDIVSKIGEFVNEGEKYLGEVGGNLHAAYHLTLQKIQQEIDNVVNKVKPVSGLIDEVKSLVEQHNGFVDELVKQAYPQAEKLFHEILGGQKRNAVDVIDKVVHTAEEIDKIAHIFGRRGNVLGTIDKVVETAEEIDKIAHIFGRRGNVLGTIDKVVETAEEIDKIAHIFGRRGILDVAGNFAQGIEHLIEEVSTPMKGILGNLVQTLEGKVISLIG